MKKTLINRLNRFGALAPLGVLLLFASSCIREELLPCPPMKVEISVKDKNYFNVKHVEGLEMPMLEGLPFKEYIPTLRYTLSDARTGKTVYEKDNFEVTAADTAFCLTFPEELPHGRYKLTVWGGLKNEAALSADRTELNFHPGQREGEDVYLTSDILEYTPYVSDFKVDMERTKGKLVVDVEHLDAPVHLLKEDFTGYSAKVDELFNYSGSLNVEKSAPVTPSEKIVVKTYLAPSSKETKPLLSLRYFDQDNAQLERFAQKDLEVPIYRNKLTALKLIYDKNGDCTILIMIDDSWTNIHDMIVD